MHDPQIVSVEHIINTLLWLSANPITPTSSTLIKQSIDRRIDCFGCKSKSVKVVLGKTGTAGT
jgi:hypothetical protein